MAKIELDKYYTSREVTRDVFMIIYLSKPI